MKLDSIIPEIKKIIIDSNKTNDINKLIGFKKWSYYTGAYDVYALKSPQLIEAPMESFDNMTQTMCAMYCSDSFASSKGYFDLIYLQLSFLILLSYKQTRNI